MKLLLAVLLTFCISGLNAFAAPCPPGAPEAACRPDMVAFKYVLGEQRMTVRMSERAPATWSNPAWKGKVRIRLTRVEPSRIRLVFSTLTDAGTREVKTVEVKPGSTAELVAGKDVEVNFFGEGASVLSLTLEG